MKTLAITCLLLVITTAVAAQDAKDYYGGWSAEINGERHFLYVVLRDNRVSGFMCHDCENPDNLRIIDDGVFDTRGLQFRLYDTQSGSAATPQGIVTELTAAGLRLFGLKGIPVDGPVESFLFRRDVPAPNAPPPPDSDTQMNPRPNLSRTDWVLPGPAETITAEKVAGIWLYGSGPGKQWFMFRRHKDGLRGMVCGPCDAVANMAPLENITWSGTTLHFEIIHEDNGYGYLDYGPFSNVVVAQIAKQEMHMDVTTSYNPPDAPVIEMTLLGPIRQTPP